MISIAVQAMWKDNSTTPQILYSLNILRRKKEQSIFSILFHKLLVSIESKLLLKSDNLIMIKETETNNCFLLRSKGREREREKGEVKTDGSEKD